MGKESDMSEKITVVATFAGILGLLYCGVAWATGNWNTADWSEMARLLWVTLCFVIVMMLITALNNPAKSEHELDPRLQPREPGKNPRPPRPGRGVH